MLEYLRNAAEKPLAKFLIAILAFSFIGWGVAEWIFGGGMGDTTLVHVGDAEISVNQFSNQKSQMLANMSREQQRSIYTDANATKSFNNYIIGELTSQQMVQNRAHDLGFVVSDHRIATQIKNVPAFQRDGKFSSELFDNALAANGLTEDRLADVLRADIMRSMVLGPMGTPVPVPNFAVDAAYNARYATREIEYKTIRFDDFRVAKPTDDALKTYYASHPKTLPETRGVSYAFVATDMSKPDEYDAGMQRITRVEDEIIAGESLENAAKKHGAKFVRLKSFARNGAANDANITPQMVAQIFNMDNGADTEIIEAKKGFMIIHLDSINSAKTAEFASVKNELAPQWTRAEKRKLAYERANGVLVDLNKNNKMDGATRKTVTRTDGAPMAVLSDAFNNPVGTNKIVETPDAFYVISVKSVKSPAVDAKKKAALRREMEQMSIYQIQADYNKFLQRKYPIKINSKVYNRYIEK
ncbi:MAG: SurA N-terminal domain-containing protein [Alphaproteobacteria bacterium]|nr:SurA N-terminal domain-containing protein [Alphaproteobacteria bacterium]